MEIQLARLIRTSRRKEADPYLTDAAKAHLAHEGYDPVYGARPLKRAIQRDLLDPLALEILEGRFGDGDTIFADAPDGKIVFHKR